MSRFVPVLRATWLVARRYGLPRDLRALLVEKHVRRHLFEWETEELINERKCTMEQISRATWIGRVMRAHVAEFMPFTNEESALYPRMKQVLTRTKIRQHILGKLSKYWCWINVPEHFDIVKRE